MSQFHEFLNLIFGGFFSLGPTVCVLRRLLTLDARAAHALHGNFDSVRREPPESAVRLLVCSVITTMRTLEGKTTASYSKSVKLLQA
jgi:hypothetical protein